MSRSAGMHLETRSAAPAGKDRHGPAGRGRRWRSQTFADGLRAITLTARVDPAVAGALRVRVGELIERGCSRLIVDVTAAGPSGPEERRLLAGALDAHPDGCRIAVVAPSPGPMENALPAEVPVGHTLSQARLLLDPSRMRHPTRTAATPAGAISARERHALAMRQTLRWAARAAAAGDRETALFWLATVEAVNGTVPLEWQARRAAWSHARVPGEGLDGSTPGAHRA